MVRIGEPMRGPYRAVLPEVTRRIRMESESFWRDIQRDRNTTSKRVPSTLVSFPVPRRCRSLFLFLLQKQKAPTGGGGEGGKTILLLIEPKKSFASKGFFFSISFILFLTFRTRRGRTRLLPFVSDAYVARRAGTEEARPWQNRHVFSEKPNLARAEIGIDFAKSLA